MISRFFHNKKLMGVLATLLTLVIFALGFNPWKLVERVTKPAPTPINLQKKRISNPQRLGFDSLAIEKQPKIDVSVSKRLPTTLDTYEINPAPHQLFSPTTASTIASRFGFTINSKVSKVNNLYIYKEKDKTLSINYQVGTVSFSTNLKSLPTKPTRVSEEQAGQIVADFLKSISLDSQFIDWKKGATKGMKLIQGIPKETGLTQGLRFYQVTPKIWINNQEVLIPQPLYAQIALDGKIVGLYTWFINLEGATPQVKNLKSLNTAKQEIKNGQGIIFSSAKQAKEVRLDKIELAYFTPPSFFVNFDQRHFLKIVYVFYDNNGNKVYLNAVKE